MRAGVAKCFVQQTILVTILGNKQNNYYYDSCFGVNDWLEHAKSRGEYHADISCRELILIQHGR